MDLVTVLALIGAILGVASTALHLIAPKTSNTVDDRLAAFVDEAKAVMKEYVDDQIGLVKSTTKEPPK